MDFGWAISMLINGKPVTRKGWNGKGQFLTIASNLSYYDEHNKVMVNPNHDTMGNKAIIFNGTSGQQVGWLASQSDMLSKDWMIYKEEKNA